MTTTRTTTTCALLLLGLGACAGSSGERGQAASAERAAYGGDSAGAEVVSVQSADESESYDEVATDTAAESPAPTYEAGPTTGAARSPEPAPPPSMPGQMRQEPSDGMGGEPTIDVSPRFERLLSLQGDLGGVLALSTPNCSRAHDLEEAICELSEHICTIADDNPDARDARTRCRDGRDRCVRAREQVSEGCGE